MLDGRASCGGVIRDLNGIWRLEFSKFIGAVERQVGTRTTEVVEVVDDG
ncbi:hypothetical protein V6N12_033806 [Hibiscus sabdariffa]|uniref:Uncharacterized protein n=1 Tax=Hibiscus sabdariffa TaxID=183260 RepID=A0ABR1ZFC8_9ROSI